MVYKRIALFAVAMTVSMSSGLAQQKPEATPVDGKIKWVYDYEKGKQLSATLDKPMFVVFRCER